MTTQELLERCRARRERNADADPAPADLIGEVNHCLDQISCDVPVDSVAAEYVARAELAMKRLVAALPRSVLR